jgi:predicted enzyme related to lactoylglutathione lyase
MGSTINAIVIDAVDVDRVAAFWAAVLGWEHGRDADGDVVVADRAKDTALTLLVLAVPETKTLKNRVHIDLCPTGVDQAEELERLLGLGAVEVDIGQGEQSWVVLADPEGNEFCLLRRRLDAAGTAAAPE